MISRVRNAALVLPIVLMCVWEGGGAAGDAAENSAGNTEVEGPLGRELRRPSARERVGNARSGAGRRGARLMVNLSTAEANAYFAARAEQGFNAAWVNVLVTTYTGGREDATTYDGIAPFSPRRCRAATNTTSVPERDLLRARRRDRRHAADHGIHLWFDPIETGGFLDTLSANGLAAAREYGRFLGRRYKDANNIVWMSGNDFRV